MARKLSELIEKMSPERRVRVEVKRQAIERELLEEKADMAALRAALAETRSRREKPIPWERARNLLGL